MSTFTYTPSRNGHSHSNGNGNGHHKGDALIVPPHSTESEEAVLGSCLIDEEAIHRCAGVLGAHDFYVVKHQWVYEAMLDLRDAKEPIDLLTVSSALERAGRLSEIGGEAFIALLTNAVPTALNVMSYAAAVATMAERRRLITAAGDIARMAFDQARPIEDVRTGAQTTLMGACAQHLTRERKSIVEAASQWFGEWREMVETGAMPGIPTGIPDFNQMLGGYKSGKLIVFAALPGAGKTTAMKVSALHAARRERKRVGIWTLEMEESEYVEMLASEWARVDVSAAAVARMEERHRAEALQKVEAAINQIYRLENLHIFYTPGITPAQWLFEAQALKAEKGLDMAVFDYIQIARGDGGGDWSREQEVNSIALGLKEGAGKLGIPVLAGSQVNDDGRVRESRGIEQHADTVIHLKQGESDAHLLANFTKNRRGPKGERTLFFNKKHSHIGGTTSA